jgi:hypothetical protein
MCKHGNLFVEKKKFGYECVIDVRIIRGCSRCES